jgi:hypothetical protein
MTKKRRNRRPPRKIEHDMLVHRSDIVASLKLVKARLDTLAALVVSDARQQAWKRGKAPDTRRIERELTANHFALLNIVCQELGIDPKEIDLEEPSAIRHSDSIILPS